jgi:ArsR family transcriptional regulator
MPRLTTSVRQLKAAGDDTRLRLLALLRHGERTVKDLTEVLGQSQPRISRHLKLLGDAALVERLPEGAWVYYRLSENEPGASLVAAILAATATDDPVLSADMERLEQVRWNNQKAADRYFGEHAGDWDRLRRLHGGEGAVEAAIRDAVGAGPYRALLDIGTGTGRMLTLLADRVDRSLGVDLSRPMLNVARANLERAGVSNARLRVGDALRLPVPRDSFDLVIVHQVLHFLDDPARAVAEAAKAVTASGRLLIIDLGPHEVEQLRSEHAHRRLGFSHEQVAQWIGAAGLTITAVRDLKPKARLKHALSVTLWSALDRRIRLAGGLASGGDPA